MAMGFYMMNWGALQHLNPPPEMATFLQASPPPDLASELFAFHDNFTISDTCMDSIFKPPDSLIYSENNHHTNIFPYNPISSSSSSSSLDNHHFTNNSFPLVEFSENNYSYPECPSLTYGTDQEYHNSYWGSNSSLIPNVCFNETFVRMNLHPGQVTAPEFLPELLVPLPEFQIGGSTGTAAVPVYNCGVESGSNCGKKGGNGRTLSAQSMAARVRRRKITEKTQELGKLIPGGHKMNTAEMFQAASKYIKFMQAQVGILQLMQSIPENEESFHREELQALVTSPLVQEKLYSAEKFFVPKHFVETLENDHKPQPNSLPLKDSN